MNLYKKGPAKAFFFFWLLILLLHQIILCFRKNPLERIQKSIITIDDKIKDEKLQYDINREAAKLSALSSGKIYKHEYLRDEEILPSDQIRTTEQAKLTYSPLGKAFEKHKTIEDQGIEQIEALKTLKSEENQELKTTEGLFPKKIGNGMKKLKEKS